MVTAHFLMGLISAGWAGLLDYLSAHVLFCLIPAFFLAGAINVLISQKSVLKLLGKKTNPFISYGIAAVAGLFIEVCSCTILPLFAGIWKKGSGLGPAITFLYAGPAINIVAVSLTARVIGWDIALTRLVLSITFAVTIGIAMVLIFKERKTPPEDMPSEIRADMRQKPVYQQVIFFGVLTMILLLGTAPLAHIFGERTINALGSMKLSDFVKYFGTLFLVIVQAVVCYFWYTKTEITDWLKETFKFMKMIFPLLLVGVFFASMVGMIMPPELFLKFVGENTVMANLIGVLFGTFAYFPALVEVPIAEQFLRLGMHKGPLLAYLLADPVLSLQSILIVNKVLKPKRTIAYVALIVITTTAAGLLFGIVAG